MLPWKLDQIQTIMTHGLVTLRRDRCPNKKSSDPGSSVMAVDVASRDLGLLKGRKTLLCPCALIGDA